MDRVSLNVYDEYRTYPTYLPTYSLTTYLYYINVERNKERRRKKKPSKNQVLNHSIQITYYRDI